jgi:hypothetical protein
MLITAIILFVVAAIFGLIVLTAILKDQPTPKPVVFTHGPIAAIALIMVITYSVMGHTDPLLITSIVLFVLAALGGLTLFTIDMRKKPIPKLLAVIHPLVAVIALVTLIIYVLQALCHILLSSYYAQELQGILYTLCLFTFLLRFFRLPCYSILSLCV